MPLTSTTKLLEMNLFKVVNVIVFNFHKKASWYDYIIVDVFFLVKQEYIALALNLNSSCGLIQHFHGLCFCITLKPSNILILTLFRLIAELIIRNVCEKKIGSPRIRTWDLSLSQSIAPPCQATPLNCVAPQIWCYRGYYCNVGVNENVF